MPITRIKNNQVTDASAGNIFLGINAAVKLQDHSITAGKIANSLVYGSDLTVTGNLTVNGQTTTIDTVSVVIEDPILYLAADQTGAPSVDIGFIGERGASQNIAFVWDESVGEFVTVFTNDTTNASTVTIASYADFHTNNANIGGNLTVNGTTNLVGNVTLANISASGQIFATGNITGGNLVSNANISAATAIFATGDITGGNLVSNAAISAATTINATGDITGGNLVSNAAISAATTINATGNITGGNLISNAAISAATTIDAIGNITGGNLTVNGTTNLVGNVTLANISASGQIFATGDITGGNLVSNANISAATAIFATGDITGGNLVSNAAISAATTINATGNITGGNVTTAGKADIGTLEVTGTSSLSGNITSALNVTGNIAGGNISTNGRIDAVGNISGGNIIANDGVFDNLQVSGDINVTNVVATGLGSFGTTVSATGNITGGNIISNSLIQGGNLSINGDALIAGNLAVQGNLTYINVDDLRVEDPIIQLGGGANGNALVSNDGKDRGTLLTYFTTGPGNAFVGFDNSTGNMIIADSVGIANDVITVNGFGTLQAGNVFATGNITATANIAGNFVAPGSNTQVMYNDNGLIAGDAGMTYNATTDALTVVGDITGGNLVSDAAISAATTINATGDITGGNLVSNANISAATAIFATGDITGGNLVSNAAISAATTINATGNITGGNLISNAAISAATTIDAIGNITGGNLTVNGTTTLVGNVTLANISASGQIFATGNITGGNLNTVSQVAAATGNFTGNVDVLGNLNATTGVVNANSAIFLGNTITGNNAAFAGIQGFTQLGSNVVMQFAGNVNSYSQLNFQNINNGTAASTDYIATADNGDDSNFYVNLGINSSTFNDPSYAGYGPNDSYVHNHGGNLILNPETAGKTIQLMVGGTDAADVIAQVTEQGLQVDVGNLTTSNIISVTGRVTVNSDNSDTDFAVNGDTTANLMYVDAGTGTISFGSSTQTTGALVSFNSNTSILAPAGNTAQRPNTPVSGMVRFNTSTSSLEFYNGDQWRSTDTVFTLIQSETFNGDGSTTEFTINSGYTTLSCLVSINGIVQVPTTAYAIEGTTLTFTEAPAIGDLIEVREITTTTTVRVLTNANGSAMIEVTDSDNYIQATGNLLPTANVTYDLGSSSLRWKDGYFGGNSITLGNIVLKNTTGNTLAFFGPDGTTPGTLISNNVTAIANGTSNVQTLSSGTVNISAGGNANVVSVANGSVTVKADILNGQANGVGNIGTSINTFNTIFAKATSAQYADLAENYESDAAYESGTVVCFGGAKEITFCNEADCTSVAGVISTNPSYLMNSGQTGAYVAAVALQGRVPTKVTGQIRKGDLMVAAGDGRARANNNARAGTIIGKALADFDGQDGVIEVVVGRV